MAKKEKGKEITLSKSLIEKINLLEEIVNSTYKKLKAIYCFGISQIGVSRISAACIPFFPNQCLITLRRCVGFTMQTRTPI